MKKLSMLLFAFAALAITSCSDKNDDNSQNSGATALATPVLSIDEASVSDTGFTVTWEAIENAGSYTYVVDNGSEESTANTRAVITGLSSGSHTVKVKAVPSDTQTYKESAWATISQTIGGQGGGTGTDFTACLEGSDYYLVVMDETTAVKLSGNIVADYRTDDTTKFLYVWENTYIGGTATGPNFFGNLDGYVTMSVVANSTWSGAGFFSTIVEDVNKLRDISNAPEDYTLHIGLKSQDTSVLTVTMYSYDGGAEPTATIGDAANPDGCDFSYPRDGEWHEIEIPMTHFSNKGWAITRDQTAGQNVLAVSNGTYGTLNIDACFFYKKAN